MLFHVCTQRWHTVRTKPSKTPSLARLRRPESEKRRTIVSTVFRSPLSLLLSLLSLLSSSSSLSLLLLLLLHIHRSYLYHGIHRSYLYCSTKTVLTGLFASTPSKHFWRLNQTQMLFY